MCVILQDRCWVVHIPISVYVPSKLVLNCAYPICLYGQILISCTIPSGSLSPPSHVYSYTISYTLSVLICCIILIIWLMVSSLSPLNLHLLGGASYLFLLWLFTPLELFTSVLADGFSLESEWQQVSSSLQGGCPRGVMIKAMDCGILVSEFVFQSRYYVHFRANTLGKVMNTVILPAMG